MSNSSPARAALLERAASRALAIRDSGLDIYEALDVASADLFFPDKELEVHLDTRLRGQILGGPIRTRSKLAKQLVAEVLGYARPSSFRRTKPRFPGQDFDVHVQQDNNLQIWNQEVSAERRYVLIRPSREDIVRRVRVVRGQHLAAWDRTGTLTSKYQAKRHQSGVGSTLVSDFDTVAFQNTFGPEQLQSGVLWDSLSSSAPSLGLVMPIYQVFDRLLSMVGTRLRATRPSQDRTRGELLQQLVSDELGIGEYANFGKWPDIVNQALEVKLQTSSTIDLGLVLPSDTAPARALGPGLRYCDARYAVVYGELLSSGEVEIRDIVLTTGEDFFEEFVQFGGLVQNHKRQIRLPHDLFYPY